LKKYNHSAGDCQRWLHPACDHRSFVSPAQVLLFEATSLYRNLNHGGDPLENNDSSLIVVKRELRASPESAWDLLTDTTKWRWWGPTVRGVTCSDRYIRKGSLGKVRTPIGLWVPFLITEYEHESYWTWKVAGIQATGHRLVQFNPDSCMVAFELPLSWLPYSIVCRIALKRMAKLLEA
jgi:hypothetical protein